jgi:drug/metabolite transporter (DMT)-like permease
VTDSARHDADGAPRLRDIGILLFGVFTCATSVIMIKASTVHPALLAALRLFIAATVLMPLFLRDRRRLAAEQTVRELVRPSVLPGFVLALHFMSWIIGARMTPAANSSLIVNLVPVAMPFLLHFMLNERLSAIEYIATVIAIIGMGILAFADFNVSQQHFTGDLMCFGSMLLFAWYLALSRKHAKSRSIWLYVVPLYWVGGLTAFTVSLFLVNPIQTYPRREVLLILGLGVVPTVMGHSSLNYAMKALRGQVVSIVNMGQFVFAGTMGYIFFKEVPHRAFYLASVLLISAGVIVVCGRTKRDAKQIDSD